MRWGPGSLGTIGALACSPSPCIPGTAHLSPLPSWAPALHINQGQPLSIVSLLCWSPRQGMNRWHCRVRTPMDTVSSLLECPSSTDKLQSPHTFWLLPSPTLPTTGLRLPCPSSSQGQALGSQMPEPAGITASRPHLLPQATLPVPSRPVVSSGKSWVPGLLLTWCSPVWSCLAWLPLSSPGLHRCVINQDRGTGDPERCGVSSCVVTRHQCQAGYHLPTSLAKGGGLEATSGVGFHEGAQQGSSDSPPM